jgi:hypothetical protein
VIPGFWFWNSEEVLGEILNFGEPGGEVVLLLIVEPIRCLERDWECEDALDKIEGCREWEGRLSVEVGVDGPAAAC